MTEPVLRLTELCAGPPERPVLDRLSLSLSHGTLCAIIGRRGAGRSTLAAIAAGRRLPRGGRVERAGRLAPLVGHSGGFGVTGSVARDLALRAAACGVSSEGYVAAIAGALDGVLRRLRGERAGWLTRRFEDLLPVERLGLLHAAAWAMPADLYIADGPLLPQHPALSAALMPALRRARTNGAVLWLSAGVTQLRAAEPDMLVGLSEGRLRALGGLEEAQAFITQRAALAPSRSVNRPIAPRRPMQPRAEALARTLQMAKTASVEEVAPLLLSDPIDARRSAVVPQTASRVTAGGVVADLEPKPAAPSTAPPADETQPTVAPGLCLITEMRRGAARRPSS
ncbi:MAG: ATP-binding cassette domain-containing protein [Pseudomonadota bacterium]